MNPNEKQKNDQQPEHTDEVRIGTAWPKQGPSPKPPVDVPPWTGQTPSFYSSDHGMDIADHPPISAGPNTLEYWKTIAIQNGDSCRKMLETVGKAKVDLQNAIRQKNEIEKQLALERNRTAVIMPNDLFSFLTKCTTGKVQSITIYFADNSYNQEHDQGCRYGCGQE